jgi:uncharacterized membrane protein YhiD involved in acid resistance
VFSSQNPGLFPITGAEILISLSVALLCGLGIAWLYRQTYKGPGYPLAFVNSLVLLTMITSVVILTIGSNLARAFGLVGAMSIIRFRTAVKDTQDIVYIFFALAVGLASGCGAFTVAILGTICIGTVIFVFARVGASGSHKQEYLLEVSYSANGNGDGTPTYIPVFRRYCRSHHVINTRAVGEDDDRLEIAYYVKLRDKHESDRFVRELRRSDGVNQVNLYFDEEQF